MKHTGRLVPFLCFQQLRQCFHHTASDRLHQGENLAALETVCNFKKKCSLDTNTTLNWCQCCSVTGRWVHSVPQFAHKATSICAVMESTGCWKQSFEFDTMPSHNFFRVDTTVRFNASPELFVMFQETSLTWLLLMLEAATKHGKLFPYKNEHDGWQ